MGFYQRGESTWGVPVTADPLDDLPEGFHRG